MKKVGIILVNYRDYAKRFLAPCWQSILNQDYQAWHLAIVDNASTEETYNYLKKTAPEAKIITNLKNDGFAKGNNDAIKYFLEQDFPYVFLLNMDAYLAPGALRELVAVAENNPSVAALQARLMLANDKTKINSLGNISNFLAFGYCSKYLEEYQPKGLISRNIAYPSGAAVLLRATALGQIGLFDEQFWMYNEDQDLGWRFWLAGWQCQIAYQAVAYHHYEFSRSIAKYYYMDRNRIIAGFKNYSWLTLVLFAPAFFLSELALLLLAWRGAWLKKKLKVWAYFLKLSNWSYLLKARRASQRLRKNKDSQIMLYFSGKIKHQAVDSPFLRYIANPLLALYFFITKQIIRILGF